METAISTTAFPKASLFAREGARVAIADVESQLEAANKVCAEVQSAGGTALAATANVANRTQVEGLVETVVKQFGRLDILVANAGITRDAFTVRKNKEGEIKRMSEEQWDAVLNVNLRAVFLGTRAAAKVMLRQRGGRIINMASFSGLSGNAGQANYAASKAGLMGLTRACARELGPYNIRVNAVLPGYLLTDMGRKASNAVLERVRRENALGRPSDPEEVAEFVYRLSLMENVSGQTFNLDSRII